MAELKYDKKNFIDLCKKYDFSIVILHGSYAKGSSRSGSDIDVAFLGNPGVIKERYFDIVGGFSSIFGDKFDPVFLNGAESMITYQVALNGSPLYEKIPGVFSSFKMYAIARYMDTKKFRLLEKQYIKSVINKNE